MKNSQYLNMYMYKLCCFRQQKLTSGGNNDLKMFSFNGTLIVCHLLMTKYSGKQSRRKAPSMLLTKIKA